MSGMARAALTMPGSIAPLASCSREASLRICAMSRSSATTRAGTRIPGLASGGIRHRYGATCSIFIRIIVTALAGGGGCYAATAPRDSDHGDQDADHARELGNADRSEPEAIEPDGFDRKAADGVEPDVDE